jgi:hypothetical protein
MATYIGYYRVHPDYAREMAKRDREAGQPVPRDEFRAKVASLRDELPPAIRLIGSYVPMQSWSPDPDTRHPAIWVCECDDPAELRFVTNYYAGFLLFEWIPVEALGTVSAHVEATLRGHYPHREDGSNAQPAG